MYEKPSSLKTTQVQSSYEAALRLLPLMLLVVCCSVKAEWVEFDGNNKGTVFIDPKSVRQSGSYLRIWVLVNQKEKGTSGERSMVAYEEHACREGRYRPLQISSYSGSMGDGKKIWSMGEVGNWKFIRPNSNSIHDWLCK